MKNRGKQKRAKNTIQTILNAAIQVLVIHGYEKATTNRVAERAGYSVGTLYQYFEDKEDIYGEVIDQALVTLVQGAANCPIEATLGKTLQQFLQRILQGVEHDPAIIHALEALLVGQFRAKRDSAFELVVGSTTRLLEAHRSEIVVEDLNLAARMVVGASEGLSNGTNLHRMKYHELEAHILRLQVAYLTMKNPII